MKIFQHFSVVGFCNTYLVGPDNGGDAILIDPGHVDTELIDLIEGNDYSIKTVLLTHRHKSHVAGLGTLMKIYDPEIFAYSNSIYEYNINEVKDNDVLERGGIRIEVIHLPGHSLDSMVYRIGHSLFTGDTLMASRIGSTNGYMEKDLLLRAIQKRLMSLPPNLLIFPGHGAPSKIGIEKLFNPELYEMNRRKDSTVKIFGKS